MTLRKCEKGLSQSERTRTGSSVRFLRDWGKAGTNLLSGSAAAAWLSVRRRSVQRVNAFQGVVSRPEPGVDLLLSRVSKPEAARSVRCSAKYPPTRSPRSHSCRRALGMRDRRESSRRSSSIAGSSRTQTRWTDWVVTMRSAERSAGKPVNGRPRIPDGPARARRALRQRGSPAGPYPSIRRPARPWRSPARRPRG